MWLVGSDRLDFAILQKSQEERLHAKAHFADFVEKQRPVLRELDLPPLVAVGAGKAALDVSEQLGLEERFRHAGAIHRHERRRFAGDCCE